MKPLCLEEARAISKENGGKEELEEYFKEFSKLKAKDVAPFKKDLEALGNHKIKGEDLVKIMDLLPEDTSDVNKIFVDLTLDDNEIKQILEIVSKYK